MNQIDRLLKIMQQLRDPQNGCPWDQAQTYKSIVPHTLEEAYEVVDTIEREQYDELKDELGDLLFQVVFYAQIASEEQRFNFDDIARGISEKLQRRHPHVFADVTLAGVDEQTQHWETLKQQEREAKTETVLSALDGIARALPATTLAQKLQKRAARVGFDWPDWHGVCDKVQEELAELQSAWDDEQQRLDEMGDLLFACINLARHAGVDAETALRAANRKFERRFRYMEQQLLGQGQPLQQLDADSMEEAWQAAKQELAD